MFRNSGVKEEKKEEKKNIRVKSGRLYFFFQEAMCNIGRETETEREVTEYMEGWRRREQEESRGDGWRVARFLFPTSRGREPPRDPKLARGRPESEADAKVLLSGLALNRGGIKGRREADTTEKGCKRQAPAVSAWCRVTRLLEHDRP